MSDKDVLDRARLLFIDDTQGDKLAREVIAIAERLIPTAPMCKRCGNLDDGRRTCMVECHNCHGSGLDPVWTGSCRRCRGARNYPTSHLMLTDDPCAGTVEVKQ